MRIPILNLLFFVSVIYTVAYACRILWLKKHDKAVKLDLLALLAIPAVLIAVTGLVLVVAYAIVG